MHTSWGSERQILRLLLAHPDVILISSGWSHTERSSLCSLPRHIERGEGVGALTWIECLRCRIVGSQRRFAVASAARSITTLIVWLLLLHLELKHLLESAACLWIFHLQLRDILTQRLTVLATNLTLTTASINRSSSLRLISDLLSILLFLSGCCVASDVPLVAVLLAQCSLVHALQITGLLQGELGT